MGKAKVARHAADVVAAHGLLQADGRGVDRLGQRGGQGDLAQVVAGVVLGGPGLRALDVNGDRRIQDGVVGREPLIQRRRIDKGLERRAGLPLGLGRAVEGARGGGIAPADHRAHRPIRRHDHHRGLHPGPVLDLFVEHPLQRPFSLTLDGLVEGGGDGHVLGGFRGQESRPRFHHPVGEIPAGTGGGRLGQHRRVIHGLRVFGLCQVALFLHQPQDQPGAILRALQVRGRGKEAGRLEQPGQHRGLGRVHLGGGFAEIALRRGLEPAGAGPQVAAVHIDVEDVRLGIFRFQCKAIGDFLDLAPQRAGPAGGLVFGFVLPLDRVEAFAQAQQLGNLLGDGRAAVSRKRAASLRQVDADGAGDAAGVDADMIVEPLVLGRDDGIPQIGRDLVGADGVVGLAPPGEHPPLAVEHRHRAARPGVEQRLRIGQGRVVIGNRQPQDQRQRQPGAPERPPDHPPDQRHRPRHPAGDEIPALAGLARGLLRPARLLLRRQATARGRRALRGRGGGIALVGGDAPGPFGCLHACILGPFRGLFPGTTYSTTSDLEMITARR